MIFDRWYSKGQVKVFNHWMRALMRAEAVNLHQHVMVAVYQEVDKELFFFFFLSLYINICDIIKGDVVRQVMLCEQHLAI